MLPMRPLILAVLFGTLLYAGDDITIPLHDGTIVLIDPQFIRVNEYGSYVPELSFRMRNQTSTWWRSINLQFEMGGFCKGEVRQWSRLVMTSLGWKLDEQFTKNYRDSSIPLVGKVDGCRTEIIKAVLVLAENEKLHIDGVASEPVDLGEQLREIKTKRDAEARIAAEEQARKDAAEVAKYEAEDAQRKKKDAEDAARYAKERAKAEATEAARQKQLGAEAAQERARLRAACAVIYKNTADKKMGDLTVKEDQQVKACQALGLYPPR
jgi:hypothetical protein